MRISTAIITLNEEENIEKAVNSVFWTDEVVVIDSGSVDRTVEIARNLGAKVIEQSWLGFGRQKQFAVEACSHRWILSIDADEVVTPELREEIESLQRAGEDDLADGYLIPRLTEYMGRRIKHSGWYPDRQLRLFNRNRGRWKDMVVHESVEMDPDSKVSRLINHLGHISVKSVAEHHRMIGKRYAPLGAEQMALDGKYVTQFSVVYSAPVTFFRSYFLKLGFLDGFPGFCIAVMAAYNSFLKGLLRYESQRSETE